MRTKTFDSYEDYVALQKEKTEDPVRREKWIENLEANSETFKDTFIPYIEYIKGPALCLGARTGEEVLALKKLGIKNALGVDLVPNLPLVVEGDLHNLEWGDESVEFIYSNVVDHVLYPEKFFKECFRVLKPKGVLFIQLQLGTDLDHYGVLCAEDANEILREINYTYETLVVEPPPCRTPHNHALNLNVILRRLV